MVRLIFAAVLLAVAACCPKCRGGEPLPQSTLGLPQDMTAGHGHGHGNHDGTPHASGMTGEAAYDLAVREGRPLVLWVGGGDAVCPACMRTLRDEAVHFVAKTYPGVSGQALVVLHPHNGHMRKIAVITRWTTGDVVWGHTASIRRAIDSWRIAQKETLGGWSVGLGPPKFEPSAVVVPPVDALGPPPGLRGSTFAPRMMQSRMPPQRMSGAFCST